MVGSSPAGAPDPRPALPPAGATPEVPEEAADRPGPPSAPLCCCCLHLGPSRRFSVHKQPGERTPPVVGQPPAAIAEDKTKEKFIIYTIIQRAVLNLCANTVYFTVTTLYRIERYDTIPVLPLLNLRGHWHINQLSDLSFDLL